MIGRRRQAPPRRRRTRGAGLIELLMAVLLLAVGGLSVAMAQMTALRRVQGTLLNTVAVHASVSLGEAMRANRSAMLAGDYNTAGELCPGEGDASGGSLAQRDLHRWVTALGEGMDTSAAVCGSVQCQAGICRVGVHWDDNRAAGTQGAPRASMILGVAP